MYILLDFSSKIKYFHVAHYAHMSTFSCNKSLEIQMNSLFSIYIHSKHNRNQTVIKLDTAMQRLVPLNVALKFCLIKLFSEKIKTYQKLGVQSHINLNINETLQFCLIRETKRASPTTCGANYLFSSFIPQCVRMKSLCF